jgi:hypothetical protein
MKLSTTSQEFNELPHLTQVFLLAWKEKKGYALTKEFSMGELIELAAAVTSDLQFDESDGRTFNNCIRYNEVSIAWDGIEPIEILWFELTQKIKRRITQYLVVSSK